MRTAEHVSTTPTPTPVKAQALGTSEPKRVTALDPNLLPDEYALVVEGDCLVPEIVDGACLAFDKRLPFAAGDFVVLWRKPELVQPGRHQAIIKRLVTNVPPDVRLPYREHPLSEVRAVIIAEQINPQRRFAIPLADLLAIHRCLGPVPADVRRVKISDDDIRAMHRPKRRSSPKVPALVEGGGA